MTDTDHICELPEPTRGATFQCPECHAEWQALYADHVVYDGDPNKIGWYQSVTTEQAAKQVEDLMHELAHEDIDPAVIGAYMWTMGRIVGQIISIVHRSHGQSAAVALAKAWNAFAESAQPYFLAEPCEHHTYKHGG